MPPLQFADATIFGRTLAETFSYGKGSAYRRPNHSQANSQSIIAAEIQEYHFLRGAGEPCGLTVAAVGLHKIADLVAGLRGSQCENVLPFLCLSSS